MVFFYAKMEKNKILFLKEENFISSIHYIEKKEDIYSIKSELNSLAKRHFFSISEYRKLVRKQLPLKNKIPIYFSPSLLLFCIRERNCCYWINYFNILKICYEENIIIIFKDGSILEADVKKKILLQELEKINKVLAYKKELDL